MDKTVESNKKEIIWHHSADSSNDSQFDKINAYHKSMKFPKSALGFFIGYHWLIEQDGSIRQCRAEWEEGAHAKGNNLDSIGVCLAGNFNVQIPNERQRESAALLIQGIINRWNIPLSRIKPHRAVGLTDCPGWLLPENWLIYAYVDYKLGFIKGLLQKLLLKIKG